MPKPYPKEFRDDVVAVARSRPKDTTLKQIAVDFGLSDSCLANWLAIADADEGRRSGPSSEEVSELRAAKRRIRVLKLVRQDYYRWLASPITPSELEEAYLANALFDAHRDDPEFGYRFLADEVKDSGFSACERTIWKVCSTNGWWSSFGKKKTRKKAKAHTPAHDDLVKRRFCADTLDHLWLGDITEHQTTWIPAVVATIGLSRL